MVESKVSKRYAKSLLDLATETGHLEQAYDDMKLVHATLMQSRDLNAMFRSPVIGVDKKLAVINAVFAKNVGELVGKFMRLITEKGREAQLQAIAESFVKLYNLRKGITEAVVTSANNLSPDAREKVLALVKQHVGGEVQLKEVVNPDLIGGFVLRIGDHQVDTSILTQVRKMRKEFGKNLYVKDF